MRPLYRADQVGSFLRPSAILLARGDPAVPTERLREIEDSEILRLLARQKELGFRIYTDGELRRSGFMSDFYDAVDGFDRERFVERGWSREQRASPEASPPSAPVMGLVVRPITQKRRLAAHEATFMLRHSPGDVKITLPSATQFPAIAYRKGVSERAYPTPSAFLHAIVPIIRNEVRALLDEGVRYIQLDAPRYSYYVDPKWRDYIRREMGVSPEAALDEAIRADNACLAGARGRGAVVAIHLCRGNNRSQWYAEGGYDPIAEKLFAELEVDLFLLEYDSERAGTFEPLRFVPRDKGVVLGLVSSKAPELEPVDALMRRIDEASRYVPLERLALSPQCGFASSLEGNLLTEEQQWRKMALVGEAARALWNTQ